jgi:dTDP-4-dehydrorhamnose 3,5-epimerase
MSAAPSAKFEISPLSIPELKVILTRPRADARGAFAEVFNHRELAAAGIEFDGVQDNLSLSTQAGTVRGFHFQAPPYAQAKLVRVLRGAILDAALDIRRGSPTYGSCVARVLRANPPEQLLIPAGFAHAFCTLEPDTEVFYKVDNYYSAEHDQGVLWNDPDIDISWPISADQAVLSDKDRRLPRLRDIVSPFQFEDRQRAHA